MDDVTVAIADPARRHILEMLRGQRLAAGEIADRFDISRPAVSRHLRVLRDSGLVRVTLVGRRRLYELDPSRLTDLSRWLAWLTGSDGWQRRFDALETEVHRARRDRRRGDAETLRREQTA
ncbi:metalloregulator ArsR/SmtB family transcription factor [Micromonospora nigra]|uniref:metalloregulator ArsR/SmtB family transcription factor n=1 Tax=Micromonospora nigra TaxID=145857 RepID=UPI000B89B433|nr:metalloregulator ArsR/SmtB family transcription factor [Micromonospora nigra]